MARQQVGAPPSRPGDTARMADVVVRMPVVSVRNFGATGDGTTDDTAALASAMTAARAAGKPLYLPAGTYLVTALPAFADQDRIWGDGRWATKIMYAGTGTLATLTGRQFVEFRDLQLWATAANAKLLKLAGCFRCSFNAVIFRGNHTGANTTYQGQVGIELSDNTGGTFFTDCDFQNLGYGMKTSCIENEMVNCKFTVCWRSLHGVGGTANAGMYLANIEFVGGDDTQSSETHLLIDGSANSWSLVNVWLEKADYGARIGVAGGSGGGPSQFAMHGCKVGARVVGLQINNCRQPHLSSVEFDLDQGGTMTPLVINADYAAEGVAINCVNTLSDDFQFANFPPYWFVVRRGNIHAGGIDMYAMGSDGTAVTNKDYVDYRLANRVAFDVRYDHTLGGVTRATGTGTGGSNIKLSRAVKITRFTAHVRTADASGTTTVQVLKNGSSTGMPSISMAVASQVGGVSVSGSGWNFADGDIISFNITAVGGTPGQGLAIEVSGIGNA